LSRTCPRLQDSAELDPLGSYSSRRWENRVLTQCLDSFSWASSDTSKWQLGGHSACFGGLPEQGAGAEACLPRHNHMQRPTSPDSMLWGRVPKHSTDQGILRDPPPGFACSMPQSANQPRSRSFLRPLPNILTRGGWPGVSTPPQARSLTEFAWWFAMAWPGMAKAIPSSLQRSRYGYATTHSSWTSYKRPSAVPVPVLPSLPSLPITLVQ
jgi:hypothetical protein